MQEMVKNTVRNSDLLLVNYNSRQLHENKTISKLIIF